MLMPKITFSETGQSYEVAQGTFLLDFCQDHDVPQPFGCTSGHCGACLCIVSAGAENVNSATAREQETIDLCSGAAGARLGCLLKIHGDITISPV